VKDLERDLRITLTPGMGIQALLAERDGYVVTEEMPSEYRLIFIIAGQS
jgi:hypothetical protein